MEVYVLTKNTEQPDFINGYGEQAQNASNIIAIFGSAERANKAKEKYEKDYKSSENSDDHEVYFCVDCREVKA